MTQTPGAAWAEPLERPAVGPRADPDIGRLGSDECMAAPARSMRPRAVALVGAVPPSTRALKCVEDSGSRRTYSFRHSGYMYSNEPASIQRWPPAKELANHD